MIIIESKCSDLTEVHIMLDFPKLRLKTIPQTALLSAAILSTGCPSNVVSTIQTEKPADGVSYFLPTNNVRIVFTNSTILSEIKAATEVFGVAQKQFKDSETTLASAKKARAAAKPSSTPEEIKVLDEAVEVAKKTLAVATVNLQTAKNKLDETKNKKSQILVEVLPSVADTTQLFVANLDHGSVYHDHLILKTTPDGLLTQVVYEAEDETSDIILNVVKTGIEAAKLYARLQGAPIGPTARGLQCTPSLPPGTEYYWEFTIDPSDPNALANVNRQLSDTPLPYLVDIRRPKNKKFAIPTAPSNIDGIYYRRPVPYTIEIMEGIDEKEDLCKLLNDKKSKKTTEEVVESFLTKNRGKIPTTKSQQVVMAAGGPVSWLSLDARPFVETKITANFNGGLLIDVDENRPSEALGGSQIPLDILTEIGNAVGEVVNNILPVKLKWTNEQTDIVESETKLLKAEQAKIEAQNQLLLDQTNSGAQVPPAVSP